MPTFVGMTTLCDRASIAAIIRQQCLSASRFLTPGRPAIDIPRSALEEPWQTPANIMSRAAGFISIGPQSETFFP
jgi:hypothetical protein